MTMLLSLIEKDSPVAIVTFETDTFEGQKIVKGEFSKDKAQIAATGIHVVYSGQTVVRHVQGTFRLEKALNGKSPELGHIEQRVTLKVGPVGNLHRDDSYKRLSRLLAWQWEVGKKKSVRLLAVWPKNSTKILDATFIGPISEKDAKGIAEVSELLKKQPFPKITEADAEEFLDSPNPWKVYVGLVRIQDLKSLSAIHFGRAIKSLPNSSIEAITDDFLTWAAPSRQKEATKELIDILGKTRPEKETGVLKSLNTAFRRNMHIAYVDLPELRKGAQAYRTKIIDDPERRDVVRELDALIEFRPKSK
jgi:hypothetical protein